MVFLPLTILQLEINSMCDRMPMTVPHRAKWAHIPILPHSIQPVANIDSTLPSSLILQQWLEIWKKNTINRNIIKVWQTEPCKGKQQSFYVNFKLPLDYRSCHFLIFRSFDATFNINKITSIGTLHAKSRKYV